MRNLEFSLVTLTTGLQVSTSAVVDYEFLLFHDESGKQPVARFRFQSRGRIGMWTILPVYTGFIGTVLGSALNTYRLPDKLRDACLRDSGADVCRDYRDFLLDSWSKVRMDFRDQLLALAREGPR